MATRLIDAASSWSSRLATSFPIERGEPPGQAPPWSSTVSRISAQALSTCSSAAPSPLSRVVRRRTRMVAGAARINNSTSPPATISTVCPQLAFAPSSVGVASRLGSVDGPALADGSAVASSDGLAVGSSPGFSSGSTVHGGADPVTVAGVGSKRTHP